MDAEDTVKYCYEIHLRLYPQQFFPEQLKLLISRTCSYSTPVHFSCSENSSVILIRSYPVALVSLYGLFGYIVDLGLLRALLPNLDPFCVALARCFLYYGSLTSIPVCNACTSPRPEREIGVLTLLAHMNTADNRTCGMIMFAFSNLRPRCRYPSSTDDRSYLQSARLSANQSKGDAMNVLVF